VVIKLTPPEPLKVCTTAADFGNAPVPPPSSPLMPVVEAESKLLPEEPGKVSDQITVCALTDRPPAMIKPALTAQAILVIWIFFIINLFWVCSGAWQRFYKYYLC
jgi:hypothetical protein